MDDMFPGVTVKTVSSMILMKILRMTMTTDEFKVMKVMFALQGEELEDCPYKGGDVDRYPPSEHSSELSGRVFRYDSGLYVVCKAHIKYYEGEEDRGREVKL
jgi:hypothetical protein